MWECGPSQRHLIADRALAYALQRHLGPRTEVSGCAGLLDAAMLHRRAQPDSLPVARRYALTSQLQDLLQEKAFSHKRMAGLSTCGFHGG